MLSKSDLTNMNLKILSYVLDHARWIYPNRVSLKADIFKVSSEFVMQLRDIDRIAPIMLRSIAHPVKIVEVPTHHRKDYTEYIDAIPLAISTNQIGLIHSSTRKDFTNTAQVIVSMTPIAHIESIP